MKHLINISLIVSSLFYWLLTAPARADEVLTLGVFPYVSPSKLIKHNTKFKQFLEQKTGRKITIMTAPNFDDFVQRTKNRDYDLIFTAPHHGRYAELHDDYQRIAVTRHNIQGYFLVSRDSAFQNLGDLRDKRLTTTPRVTILAQLALAQLHQHGLADSELNIIHTSTHSNAIYSVLNNDSDAALTGVKIWLNLKAKDKDRLRVLDKTKKIPGFMLMGKETLSPETIEQLQALVIRFNSAPAAQDYLFKGFQPIDDKTMNSMDMFTKVFN